MSCLTACGARRHGRDGRPHRPRVGKPAPASASRGRAFYASVYPSVSARRLPLSAPHRRTAQDDFCRTGEETVFGFPLRACIPHKNFISVFFGSARPRAAFPRRRNKPAPLRPVPPAPHSAAHRPAAARGLAAPPGGVRPRVARPSARAPHGRRGPPAGGFGHPKHRTYSARPSGCWSSRIGSRSGCGRYVDKIPYRIGTKYCISVVRCEDFGHGQNNAILPIGAPARLDTASGCFELPESGVCE